MSYDEQDEDDDEARELAWLGETEPEDEEHEDMDDEPEDEDDLSDLPEHLKGAAEYLGREAIPLLRDAIRGELAPAQPPSDSRSALVGKPLPEADRDARETAALRRIRNRS